MNSERYQNILQDSISMSVLKLGKEAEEWVFQQDNDPKHTSRSTVKWFNDHAITVLPWSPQFLDMSPIEHLWNEVDRRLRLRQDLPTNKDDLWKKLQGEWNCIEVEDVQKLVKSMPNRVQTLLKAKGGYTNY